MIGDVQPLTDSFVSAFDGVKGGRRIVSLIHVVNVSSSPVLVSVCECGQSGSPTIDHALIWQYEVPANDFFEFGEGVIIGAGNSLFAKASVSGAANIKISVK